MACSSRFVLGVASLVLAIGLATSAHAQGAWVGERGSLNVDLAYQYVPSTTVVSTPDVEVPDRPTKNHVITLGLEYTPIDKLAVEAALPLAMVKYTGMAAHNPPGEWDDGEMHTTLTDLRLGARYQVLDEPLFALSPHIGVSIPMADYATVGFATGGRHLKTLHLGATAARSLDPWVPNLYASLSYEFSIAEKSDITPLAEDIPQKRSDVAFEIGYLFLDGKLGINLGLNMRKQHGGLHFEDFGGGMVAPELIANHDPLLDEDFLFVGGGVSYAINDKIAVGLVMRQFVQGYNTRNQDLYGLNVSWSAL